MAEQLGADYHELPRGGHFNSQDTFPQLLEALLAAIDKAGVAS